MNNIGGMKLMLAFLYEEEGIDSYYDVVDSVKEEKSEKYNWLTSKLEVISNYFMLKNLTDDDKIIMAKELLKVSSEMSKLLLKKGDEQ